MEITSTSAAWSSVCCKIHQFTRTLFLEDRKSFTEGYIVSRTHMLRTEESHSAVKKIQQTSQNVALGSVCGRNQKWQKLQNLLKCKLCLLHNGNKTNISCRNCNKHIC